MIHIKFIQKIILLVFGIGSLCLIVINVAQKSEIKKKQNILDVQTEMIHTLEKKLYDLENPKNGIRDFGQLQVKDANIVNQRNEVVQLRGLSSHGLLWYPEYTNYRSIKTLQEYGGNAFRIAVYSDNNGYLKDPFNTMKYVYMAIENSLGADVYAIIDWHVLLDKDPNVHIAEAIQFFSAISAKYANEPGIIYEICNEPNGDTTWEDITKYANEVIPIIRKNSPNAIIIVGTPKYSTDIDSVIEKPLSFSNIMYSYHLYTGSTKGFRSNLTKALEQNIPIFVSEWGINYDSYPDSVNFDVAKDFLDFLNQNNISWINWSLSNKAEDYALLNKTTEKLSEWTSDDFSKTGQFIIDSLARKDNSK